MRFGASTAADGNWSTQKGGGVSLTAGWFESQAAFLSPLISVLERGRLVPTTLTPNGSFNAWVNKRPLLAFYQHCSLRNCRQGNCRALHKVVSDSFNLTFDEWREQRDVGGFPPTGRKGQADPIEFVAKKLAAVFRFGPEKKKNLMKLGKMHAQWKPNLCEKVDFADGVINFFSDGSIDGRNSTFYVAVWQYFVWESLSRKPFLLSSPRSVISTAWSLTHQRQFPIFWDRKWSWFLKYHEQFVQFPIIPSMRTGPHKNSFAAHRVLSNSLLQKTDQA